MIERNISNERLLGRNYQVRYNGVFTIGSYITILNPLTILNRLGNEIPILESRHSDTIMDTPRMVHSVFADFGRVQNNTRAFVFNNASITINYSFPEVTKWSGLLCDQQHVRGILQENRWFGCYSMGSLISNIVVSHSFNVSDNSYQFHTKWLTLLLINCVDFTWMVMVLFSQQQESTHLRKSPRYQSLKTLLIMLLILIMIMVIWLSLDGTI